MLPEGSRREEGRLASLALRAGVWLSGAAMAAGVLLAAWSGRAADGEALALLGVAALVATPVLRVLLLAAAFARGRQWRLLAAALAVLGLLGAGVALGWKG